MVPPADPGASAPRRRRERAGVRLAAAIAAGVLAGALVALATGLLTGHPVGAGDNGDGVRLYCRAGITPDTPTQQSNWQGGVVLDFVAGGEPCGDPVPSSAGVLLDTVVGGAVGPWSLVELGWLYAVAVAAVTAVAVWAATAAGPSGALTPIPALVPLADADFSRFFLSTYGEPAGLLGTYAFLLGVGIAGVTRRDHRLARTVALVLLAGGGILAGSSKTAYAPVAAVAAVVCALTAVDTARGRRWASRVIGPAAAAGILIVTAGPILSAQQWQQRNFATVNTHNLAYTLVLAEVGPDAAAALGLPESASARAGQAFYPEGSADVPGAEVIAADPDKVRVAAWRTLAGHPAALLRSLGIALQSTQGRSLTYLPAEAWDSGTPPSEAEGPVGAQAASGEAMHRWLDGMRTPWWPSVLALLGVLAGVAARFVRSPIVRGLAGTAGLSAVTAVGLCLVAVLGDGYFEIAKHTWLAAYLLDVTMFAVVGGLLAAAIPWIVRSMRSRSSTGSVAADPDGSAGAREAPVGPRPRASGGRRRTVARPAQQSLQTGSTPP